MDFSLPKFDKGFGSPVGIHRLPIKGIIENVYGSEAEEQSKRQIMQRNE